ncbi:CDGSH iron-sulfur domain-containing protein [uncultured Streptomyces sp.]|uniref:CDGSH iron-sulfur domain-containing protein n=1 Tax=uncultured Streptomyces sp. TaxID=174707 RepID=UPI002635DB63|nr:CDGSH iron-sulfur domain-containing protein [uncultured Streptomyces sp.]
MRERAEGTGEAAAPGAGGTGAGGSESRARLVTVDPEGPVLVEGPVTMRTPDGRTVTSDRFTVAVCTCRRSRTYPWCDTSHRRRTRASAPAGRRPDVSAADEEDSAP